MKSTLRQIAISGAIALGALQAGASNAASEHNRFNLNPAFENAFGYSIATKAGCLVYIGGIVSIDEKGELVGEGDIAAQTRRIYDQFEAVLKAHQLSLKNVVQESFFVKDINQMAAAGAVRMQRYQQAKAAYPSTAGMQISALGMPGAELEMTAIAESCGAAGK
jgi:enamine deaminase RidA (YjgF/YER057c/UK114 family)